MTKVLIVLLVLTTSPVFPAVDKKKEPEKPRHVAADINAPRPDARKDTFETREGTWMSVDVSPDGRTLLFDLLGDIYAATGLGWSGPRADHRPSL